jgi:hypothetical protein
MMEHHLNWNECWKVTSLPCSMQGKARNFHDFLFIRFPLPQKTCIHLICIKLIRHRGIIVVNLRAENNPVY